MSSKCTEFNDLLLELAYDELEPSQVNMLMAHKDSCNECRTAFEQIHSVRSIAQTLEVPEIPSHFDKDILALAKQTAAAMQSTPFLPSMYPPAHIQKPNSIFKRIQMFIFRPPIFGLGLAAAAALIAIVSLKQSPHEKMLETAQGAPFMDAAPAVEELNTEKPQLAKSDTPTKKDTNPPQIQKAGPNYQTSATAISPDAPVQPDIHEKKLHASSSKRRAAPNRIKRNPDDLLSPKASGASTKPPAASYAAPKQQINQVPTEVAAYNKAKKSKKGSARPSNTKKDEAQRSYIENDAAQEAPMTEEAAVADIDTVDKKNSLFQAGLNAYNRGDCKTATTQFKKMLDTGTSPSNTTPLATHYIAKCEKRTGRCGQALISYEKILKQYYQYSKRDEALWEAAACHKKLGHHGRAIQLLKELSLNPKWKTKAQKELDSIDKPTSN